MAPLTSLSGRSPIDTMLSFAIAITVAVLMSFQAADANPGATATMTAAPPQQLQPMALNPTRRHQSPSTVSFPPMLKMSTKLQRLAVIKSHRQPDDLTGLISTHSQSPVPVDPPTMRNCWKYERPEIFQYPERTWPNKKLGASPVWVSVDLRDGNQALPNPMNINQKLEMFQLLVGIGFKHIEVGYPAASKVEFDFCRRLIEENLIPNDVTIHILSQTRNDVIKRSLEALHGAKRVVFHTYISTSPDQRKYVFGKTREQIIVMATDAVTYLKAEMQPLVEAGTDMRLQFSPESFSATEMDFVLEISDAVAAVWQPSNERKMILNLPSTVEVSTPNVYADQVEFIGRNLAWRDQIEISVHTHNDCGTGVAASELAILAGARRVEGTLFGSGERTGNLDLVTAALNFYSLGIQPNLDLSKLAMIKEVCERCMGETVPARAPYAGALAYTAFSGSHQDAIMKSWKAQKEDEPWSVIYIPIDPADIGREYIPIRINSQSGRGGVLYVLNKHGYDVEREAVLVVAADVKNATSGGEELTEEQVVALYLTRFPNAKPTLSEPTV